MENIEKLPVFGYKGNAYFFNVYPIQDKYPGGAGVYLIAKRVPAPNALYTVVFIGQTPTFDKISLPAQKEKLQSDGVNAVCILPIESEEDRLKIVAELVERYKPICNADAND